MKKVLCGTGLVMLGAVLTMVGCGGSMQEDVDGSLANGSAEGGNQPSASAPELSSQEPEDVNQAPGLVNSLVSYCYARCWDTSWAPPFGHFEKGPFPSVKYSDCPRYSRTYCSNRGWVYEGTSWK